MFGDALSPGAAQFYYRLSIAGPTTGGGFKDIKTKVSFLGLTLGILGVWRVTHLLHAEDGPWELIVRLRRLMGGSVLGRAADCFDCLSLWIAAPCAWLVGATWLERALAWPALSAGAMVLNRVVSRLGAPPAAMYEEDPPEDPTNV